VKWLTNITPPPSTALKSIMVDILTVDGGTTWIGSWGTIGY
jgi:hypothetical protein